MIYRLRHKTTYSYNAPVGFARCVLRLKPRSTVFQTVLQSAVMISPEPSSALERDGPFGEHTLTVMIDAPHKKLVIEARSLIDVHASAPPALEDSPPWEAVRELSLETSDLSPLGPASFLYATPRTPLTPEITDYARASLTPGRPILSALDDLMRRLRSDFTYDVKATDVATPAAVAFSAKRGVCQDFAHIMISGLRGLGLPAAYVSGYLRTIPPPGEARLEGADATHAWVSAWCGGAIGWVGFDPTNAILALNDHIVLAVGRDYSDVAPIDGIILSPGGQKLKVEVDVIPEGEMALVRQISLA